MTRTNEVLPNLFIPGAARSGTSTLHQYLQSHPQICMSAVKEPHFLCRTDRGLEDYAKLFQEQKACKYRGESSTGYLLVPGVIEKIQQFMPDSRFILVLRNPVDRAWSHYWHIRGRYGAEKESFRDAFLRNMKETPVYEFYNTQYYQTGRYAAWLKRYLEAFGPERVLVLCFEDFTANPEDALQEVCDFLGIDEFGPVERLHANPALVMKRSSVIRAITTAERIYGQTVGRVLPHNFYVKVLPIWRNLIRPVRRRLAREPAPRITPEDREWVAGFYRDEVAALRELTGKPFDAWKDFPAG